MTITSMAVEELSDILHKPVEEILPMFLQSRICQVLYDRKTKLWWDGPSAIAELYLEELRLRKMGVREMHLGKCT